MRVGNHPHRFYKVKPETPFKILACAGVGVAGYFLWLPIPSPVPPTPGNRRALVPSEPHSALESEDRTAAVPAGCANDGKQLSSNSATGTAVAHSTSLSEAVPKEDNPARYNESRGGEIASGSVPPENADSFSSRARKPAMLPLAFQEVSPGTVKLTQPQVASVTEIQEQFADAVGGETAKADSPGYRKKWDEEQRLSDLRLRARIGGQAFAAWQREAHWRALEAARSTPGTTAATR